MRLIINFSKNTKPVPFENREHVLGYVHNCLKNIKTHLPITELCISHLCGGKHIPNTNTLNFSNGGYIVVTSQNTELIGKLITGSLMNKNFICGMARQDFDPIEESFVDGWNNFSTLSPFIIRQKIYNKYIVFNDEKFIKKASDSTKEKLEILSQPEFNDAVTKHMKNKLLKINPELNLNDFKIVIPIHPGHKIKEETIHSNTHYANQCHLNIFCDNKTANLLYNIGIGQLTGSGFGTIYNCENNYKYIK